jgi:hypothetical protein
LLLLAVTVKAALLTVLVTVASFTLVHARLLNTTFPE